ncbi:MAG: hypothetical protein EFT35_09305 [Methanophagales archaeon ANME-1-THS]|nr:MAG: hypothetical protein EFT35_09305 [Methanophagales archaeon ANME-1-THS]
MKKIHTSLVASALLALLLIEPCSATIGVGVGRGKIAVNEPLMSGGTYTISSISVHNTGGEASDYSVNVMYLYGQKELRPPKEWVIFEPETFHLEPNEREIVEIRLKIPLDAEPGAYFCFLEATPKTEGDGFRIGAAAATKLYFSVKPANILAALVHKAASFMAETAPGSYLLIIAVSMIGAVMGLRKYSSIDIWRKKPPKREGREENRLVHLRDWRTEPRGRLYITKIALLLLLLALVLVPIEVIGDDMPSCCGHTIYVNETGWWREGVVFSPSNTPIQHAINNATGKVDTIIVKDGTYNENVDMRKGLTIRSENGSESTIVSALNTNDHVFKITADYVTTSGFTVKNAKDCEKAGIYLKNVSHCTISDNNISNSYYGIRMIGSSYNNIINNTVSNNSNGIYLLWSSYNTLSNNTANSNNDYGIYLTSSATNTISNNYFNNTQNAYDDGTNVWNSSQTPGMNIIGGLYLGGNYWSDYTGTDTDGDGLGETPYNIAGDTNTDYLPLVTPTLISIALSLDTVHSGSLAEAGHNTSPIITATNSGTVHETFYIRGADAYYDLSTWWSLADRIGPDTFTHEFCNFSSAEWYTLSTITNNTLALDVPIGGNASFMLRITLPTEISRPGVYTTTVTIIATEAPQK